MKKCNYIIIMLIFLIQTTVSASEGMKYIGKVRAEVYNFNNLKLGYMTELVLCSYQDEIGFRELKSMTYFMTKKQEFINMIRKRQTPVYWVNRQMSGDGKLLKTTCFEVFTVYDAFSNLVLHVKGQTDRGSYIPLKSYKINLIDLINLFERM